MNKSAKNCNRSIKDDNDDGWASGFTLIEVVVSMAIFTLIIGGVVMFSVNAIKASTKSQAMQETMDNARYAIDDLAKKVRTSSNVQVDNDGKSLFFVDNLTSTKYCYQFGTTDGSGKSKMVMSGIKVLLGANQLMTNESAYKSVTSCGDIISGLAGLIPSTDLIGNSKSSIEGNFDVLKTDVDSDDPHRGFVRINVDIYYNKDLTDPTDKAESHIQTGVSILDYTREHGVF